MTGASPALGCIADDFTGATDLASMFQLSGLRVKLLIDVPEAPATGADADVIVIALKSRTAPPAEAVAVSLSALDWLRGAGCRQIYFKYCSTFDSTPRGNIGPVADALMTALGTGFTVACPAFPGNGRTIYQGHLFVGDQLLSDSAMRSHPLTPMTDANLVRVLGAQWDRKVGLTPHSVVRQGPDAIRAQFERLQAEGVACAILDAVDDDDLVALGAACAGLPLVTAGSGLAYGLARCLTSNAAAAPPPPRLGPLSAVISGSCSAATQRQVAVMRDKFPAFALDPLALSDNPGLAEDVLAWAEPHLQSGPVLVYATAPPEAVQAAQAKLGVERAGAVVEEALSKIAAGLVERGVRRLVVAGGETSGAVGKALGVTELEIGPPIDPGVPWTTARLSGEGELIALALKSGNFGADDFFLKAWARLVAWENMAAWENGA